MQSGAQAGVAEGRRGTGRAGRRPGGWTRAAVAVCACLAFAMARAQDLPAELSAAWAATGLPESALSVVVEPVDGPRMVSVNAGQPRNPASVMKLVTTFAALDSLGPAHVWRTQLLVEPGTTISADGALSGPLYLRASGDPFFKLEDLWQLLRELRVRGVRRIPELVVDRSVFGPVSIDPGAFDGDPSRPYNASPDAWMVGFGAVRLLFTPDLRNRHWRVTLDPALPGVKVEGGLKWSDNPCPGSPVVQTEPFLTSSGVSLRVAGTVSGGCGEFSLYRLALSQPRHAEAVFRVLWQEMGGSLAGRIREASVPGDAVLFATHDSPSLAEVVRSINKQSNNVMARLLLLTLGAAYEPGPATVASGDRAVDGILAARGLKLPELVLDNGSGLSRDGRISADSLARLLAAAWRSPVMPEFVSSLAISGMDGTVRRRMRDSDAAGLAHLKSGSLRDVRALAGYVLAASGRRYLVVSVVNDERAQQANGFNDKLIAWLAGQ
ncbi:D-alanyl-D-alanine carboxypeptidase/D-alanyl-D-alanine-endopeptidase (penicillin-binding protein 4) [Pigmentiphaga kullae]|uniref:D-alanyl-D-alanine carboxypeptidase/D-alanyl-D-alanine-endopeptidase (Penicillin-binding protein 4) n=1 Tax=Pigmentiphaga kullae TaxID=151784 RepID=A0A4Q7N7F1_9BURK|nr:D-alanyl-D-alanine carboxypeptidase/D-alanyl-D-alanine-endopeptidase (penicillin-binding protein 4) [Pigmentiphaga kullae]